MTSISGFITNITATLIRSALHVSKIFVRQSGENMKTSASIKPNSDKMRMLFAGMVLVGGAFAMLNALRNYTARKPVDDAINEADEELQEYFNALAHLQANIEALMQAGVHAEIDGEGNFLLRRGDQMVTIPYQEQWRRGHGTH